MTLSAAAQIVAAWLPCIVAFLIVPSSLYFRNKDAFPRAPVFVYSFCGVFIGGVCLVSLTLFISGSARPMLANILFYLGVFLVVKDSLVPVKLKDFQAGVHHENIEISNGSLNKEIAIAVLTALLGTIFPIWKWEKVAGGLVVVITCIELASLMKNRKQWLTLRKQGKKAMRCPAPDNKTGAGNIYHIVLDSFFSPLLVDYLNETGVGPDTLDGFTYFPDNLSNYDHTYPSIASFMTGSFYKGGESLKEFKNKWLSGGVMEKLYEKGYTLSQYVIGEKWTHKNTTFGCFPNDGKPFDTWDMLLNFADVWLLRIVPDCFRKNVFSPKNGGRLGFFSAKHLTWDVTRKDRLNALPVNSVALFRRLIEDEKKRPAFGHYVHAHLYFPHKPYVYTAEGDIADKTTLREQTFYAAGLLETFLNVLKEQGKYHDAAIIVHSDHGVVEDLVEGPLYRCQGDGPDIPCMTLNQLRALLLIKKSGVSGTPLHINMAVSQLADIAKTLANMAGVEWKAEEGRDLFRLKADERREIPAYLKYHTPRGEFGQAVFKGILRHIVFDTERGWKRRPNIPAVWEKD